MKRKFKLFATVASLCLCLALMAFGVYAANNVTYSTSGTVTFEVTDVFVKAETTISYANDLAKKVSSNPSGITAWTTVGNTDSRQSQDGDGNWQALSDYAVSDAFNFATSGVYRIEVKLTNLSKEDKIAITTPDLSTGTSLTNATLAKDGGNDSIVSEGIAADKNVTLTFYVSMSDAAKAASGTWKISIGLDKATS